MATITKQIEALLKARCSLLVVQHRDELRAERGIMDAATSAGYLSRTWDCATGATYYNGEIRNEPITDPGRLLREEILDSTQKAVWVLRDLHRWLASPVTLRQVVSTAREIRGAPSSEARAIVLLVPEGTEIPPELELAGITLHWPAPTREQVGEILTASVETTLQRDFPEPVRTALEAFLSDGQDRTAAIDAAIGLSAAEIETAYAVSLVSGAMESGAPSIDPARVRADKKRLIESEGLLGWYEPDPRGLDAVGGLDNLKEWLTARKDAMSDQARLWGLPAPKGAAFIGVSGCGKSLTAKASAAAFGVPCLRLDLGSLKSKYVGESEQQIRRALETAETVAPCVLWLDEIEKALGGSTGPQGDGGVSSDALGCLLGWMQEHTAPVFVVATANDVSALPPELLRKGRFDELWFVDLPNTKERVEILAATLESHGRGEQVNLQKVAGWTDGFSGAELAAVVSDALYLAWGEREDNMTTEHLMTAAERLVPLSKTASEKITDLRKWAEGRARRASEREVRKETTGIDLDL